MRESTNGATLRNWKRQREREKTEDDDKLDLLLKVETCYFGSVMNHVQS